MAQVLFFSVARESAGCAAAEVGIPEHGCDEAGFWAALDGRFPGLASRRTGWRLAVNCAYLAADGRIGPGDEVAVIPPVSGG
jgi:molybdopterin converting factor small subunit